MKSNTSLTPTANYGTSITATLLWLHLPNAVSIPKLTASSHTTMISFDNPPISFNTVISIIIHSDACLYVKLRTSTTNATFPIHHERDACLYVKLSSSLTIALYPIREPNQNPFSFPFCLLSLHPCQVEDSYLHNNPPTIYEYINSLTLFQFRILYQHKHVKLYHSDTFINLTDECNLFFQSDGKTALNKNKEIHNALPTEQ